jgi:hypothetical protein
MKFLCVPCDEPMKLTETNPPEGGAMTVVYRCPNCEHTIAMLTNPFETEVVSSLGVKIGGKTIAEGASASDNLSKCPFADVVNGTKSARDKESGTPDSPPILWTQEALKRLDNMPEFVRPMAVQGIEKMALDMEYSEINEEVLDEAKEFFGM